jgi:hypothetical protein
MHTRTHSWIIYTPAYLLAEVIENTFCYLTKMQSRLHQRGGKFPLILEDSEHQTQCPTCLYATLACRCVCVHVRLVRGSRCSVCMWRRYSLRFNCKSLCVYGRATKTWLQERLVASVCLRVRHSWLNEGRPEYLLLWHTLDIHTWYTYYL